MLFNSGGSVIVLEDWVGVDGSVVRLDVVTGGGGEVIAAGTGEDGISFSIFSQSALTCPWIETGET